MSVGISTACYYPLETEEALKEVGAFDILFDRGETHDVQQVYYIDNVRAYLK